MELATALKKYGINESSKKRIAVEPRTQQRKDFHSIKYTDFTLQERIWERFDFAREWNNLGYGRITKDNSKWSISNFEVSRKDFTKVLADVCDKSGNVICPYAGIKEKNGIATLWYNREVGPIDGIDIAVIEDFLLNYKPDEFGSTPILSEIPFGYEGAVTMRIDCDENISSGRELFELYRKLGIPFSLAIKTDQDLSGENQRLMLDVIDAGGSVVTHSHTHAPNWGGSREKAKWEAETARGRLKEVLPENYSFDWVVSPFHQNPTFAVQGLRDAGIKGFIGGIIQNDPEYLIGRAGHVPYADGMITHSQQCMLHGDCYRKDPKLEIYKQTFRNHYHSSTFFGFLDHPFSNYTYGWKSEAERLEVHFQFLAYLRSFNQIWFANIIQAMNFLWVKANTKVWIENDILKWEVPEHSYDIPHLQVRWKNQIHQIRTN